MILQILALAAALYLTLWAVNLQKPDILIHQGNMPPGQHGCILLGNKNNLKRGDTIILKSGTATGEQLKILRSYLNVIITKNNIRL